MPDVLSQLQNEPVDATQQVIYAISHDLQAPARHIRSFLQLLEMHLGEALDGEATDYAARINDAVQLLQAKLEALTLLSRVETRGVEMAPCVLIEAVDEALISLKLSSGATSVEVDVDPMAVVMADRDQLVYVIQELVANSVKFCADPVSVRVSSAESQAHCLLDIVDSGPGFPSDRGVEAFELFRRFHHQTYPGTGTGLTVVQRILERHKGAIAIDSSPEAGTTVQFAVPVAVKALSVSQR